MIIIIVYISNKNDYHLHMNFEEASLHLRFILISRDTWAFCIVLFLLLISTQAFANTSEEKAPTPTIVVSATRSEKILEEVPIPLEVVTEAEIEQQNAKDLSEAISYAKGLLVQPLHGKTGSSIRIQGIDSDRILILVDGERITASTGSTVDLSQISVSDVKQIEIVKGASSALYGSSAMGGVVNVITKTPKKGFHGGLESSVASYAEKGREGVHLDQYDLRGDLSWRNEKSWAFLNADSRNSEGFLITKGNSNLRGPDGYKNNINVGLGFKPSKSSSIELKQRVYRESYVVHDAVKNPGQLIAKDSSESVETDRTRLKSSWVISQQVSAKIQGYVETYKNKTNTSISRTAEVDSHNIDLQLQWDISDKHIVVGGLSTNGESLAQEKDTVSEIEGDDCGTNESACERRAKEFYFQLDSFIGRKLEVITGFRYQDDNSFGSHFAPKISSRYQVIEGSTYSQNIRTSIGNGYRVPNLKERYFVFDHSHLGYQVFGNANLQPEEIISYQLGYEIIRKSTNNNSLWNIEFNFFYNDMEQFIQTVFKETVVANDAVVGIYEYQNIADSRTYGAEVSGTYNFSSYIAKANLQKLKSEDKLTKLELAKNPEHVVKLSLQKNFNNKSNLLLQVQYQSRSFADAENNQRSPSFQTWDIKYAYPWRKSYKLFAGIDNLKDEYRNPEKASSDLRPVPGRKYYMGMQYKF